MSTGRESRPAPARRERIGVLGGTFDPVHVAHLAVAACALHQLALDRVLLVPAGVPYQKTGARRVSAPQHRYEMVAAAVRGHAGLRVDDLELTRPGNSYTIDTLHELGAGARRDVVLIVGTDLLDELHTWHRFDEIPAVAHLGIARRPGAADLQPPPGWPHTWIDVPALDLSSTELRERVRTGRSIEFLVPEAARSLIIEHGLYRDEPAADPHGDAAAPAPPPTTTSSHGGPNC